jgi:hypothetical protein
MGRKKLMEIRVIRIVRNLHQQQGAMHQDGQQQHPAEWDRPAGQRDLPARSDGWGTHEKPPRNANCFAHLGPHQHKDADIGGCFAPAETSIQKWPQGLPCGIWIPTLRGFWGAIGRKEIPSGQFCILFNMRTELLPQAWYAAFAKSSSVVFCCKI